MNYQVHQFAAIVVDYYDCYCKRLYIVISSRTNPDNPMWSCDCLMALLPSLNNNWHETCAYVRAYLCASVSAWVCECVCRWILACMHANVGAPEPVDESWLSNRGKNVVHWITTIWQRINEKSSHHEKTIKVSIKPPGAATFTRIAFAQWSHSQGIVTD